jgi:hypothetical protein
VRVHASNGASEEAAAAQAAHDILTNLFPASQGSFDSLLASRLATIHGDGVRKGVRVGAAVAREIIAWRQNDGSTAPPPPYVLPPLPGLWQPTPPAFAAAGGTTFPGIEPFALETPTHFLPRRYPELTSERYAADLNETKLLGSATSAARTAEQTVLARAWANVGNSTTLFTIWNNVARDVARAERFSLDETARLFALLNAAMHDGLQTAHSSKFTYGLWRPVTAIRRADEDLNPATDPDAGWTPLLTTPPYPSHSGNHACVGASAARSLALVFETDEAAFTARWTGVPPNPDVALPYTSFSQLAEDEARSRIYGGIHYQFESEASQASCVKVADYAFGNFMIPRSKH